MKIEFVENSKQNTIHEMGYIILCLIFILSAGCKTNGPESHSKPNILFIAVDDMNDWIEPLRGHPQAITPNLSKLAEESIVFTNNYCAAPTCNPSRAALITGIAPYHSDPHPYLESDYRDREKLRKYTRDFEFNPE